MFVVLDIGGTHARIALMDGNPSETGSIDSKMVKLAILKIKNDYPKDIALIAQQFLDWSHEYQEAGKELKLIAGAAGIAGAFQPDNKKLLKAVHLSSWQYQDLGRDFTKIFGCPFKFRNDTYVATAGAIKMRKLKGDFWYVNWGSGIGGALAIDLEANNETDPAKWHYRITPSELGHASLAKSGLPCDCGQIGCWDAYCAGRQLEKRYTRSLAELTQENWRPIFNDMAQGLLNLYVSYPAKYIILNGGVIQHQVERLGFLQEMLERKLTIFADAPQLTVLNHGDMAGLVGAWLLAAGQIGVK